MYMWKPFSKVHSKNIKFQNAHIHYCGQNVDVHVCRNKVLSHRLKKKCLFVISMMLCASQKGTTVRHKYFGTLDLAHNFMDKETTSPSGLGRTQSDF